MLRSLRSRATALHAQPSPSAPQAYSSSAYAAASTDGSLRLHLRCRVLNVEFWVLNFELCASHILNLSVVSYKFLIQNWKIPNRRSRQFLLWQAAKPSAKLKIQNSQLKKTVGNSLISICQPFFSLVVFCFIAVWLVSQTFCRLYLLL